jgi:hypothetical protein
MPTLQASHILDHGEALWAAGLAGSPSRAGVRWRSANARNERFVVDASVSVITADTAELDEERASVAPMHARRLPASPSVQALP